MVLVEGADVAESVVVAVHGWVLARWHVAGSLYISIPLTDSVVASRIVISTAGLAFQICPHLAILSVLRELRVEVLAVVRLVELRCHRGRIVPCHDGLLILPVSAVVFMCVATVRSVRGIHGLILFQFMVSGGGLPVSDVRSKPLDAWKSILDS